MTPPLPQPAVSQGSASTGTPSPARKRRRLYDDTEGYALPYGAEEEEGNDPLSRLLAGKPTTTVNAAWLRRGDVGTKLFLRRTHLPMLKALYQDELGGGDDDCDGDEEEGGDGGDGRQEEEEGGEEAQEERKRVREMREADLKQLFADIARFTKAQRKLLQLRVEVQKASAIWKGAASASSSSARLATSLPHPSSSSSSSSSALTSAGSSSNNNNGLGLGLGLGGSRTLPSVGGPLAVSLALTSYLTQPSVAVDVGRVVSLVLKEAWATRAQALTAACAVHASLDRRVEAMATSCTDAIRHAHGASSGGGGGGGGRGGGRAAYGAGSGDIVGIERLGREVNKLVLWRRLQAALRQSCSPP